ncbi:MAG: alanine--glyoxylate aminotransferase family protein, partial [Chloroflexi bacterium]|nr:alanine--glyoxylate aminotransferase family protein [Chloroflexota bacterium]
MEFATVNLRIPGPIPVPEDILAEMAHPMINHRGPEFKDMLFRITDGVKQVFETKGDVYTMTASGTGAMEATVVNTLSPGDKVLCVTVGSFGDRYGEIAERYGAEVTRLAFEWGEAADADRVREAVKQAKYKAVLVTHNETSTGVQNDLGALAKAIRSESDALILVDGVSSVASVPVRTDAWDLDVVATASQKGWMLPPGLAFVSFSKRAWKAHASSTMPRYYFDLSQYQHYFEIGQPPFTPGLSVYFALDKALKQLLDEGLGAVYERHASVAANVRRQVKALGLALFPVEAAASDTVTAVRVPEGVDGVKLLSAMRERGVVLAGGHEKLKGKIIRIG